MKSEFKKMMLALGLTFLFLLVPLTTECADAQAAETVYTAVVDSNGAEPLKLRSGPSTKYKIKKKIPRGATIEIIGDYSGSWYKARYKKTKGYVYAKYITIKGKKKTSDDSAKSTSSKKVKVDDNGSVPLRIRSGPSTSYKVLGKIPRGSTIKISGAVKKNWVKATYKGITGYVCTDYLELNEDTDQDTGSSTDKDTDTKSDSEKTVTYKKITLDVPSYFQLDSRWRYEPLGTSDATIGSAGCTTTCLAMLESYYTKKKYTPLKAARKQDFTSDGYLYWPDDYVAYEKSQYLSFLYKKIKSGNPVLCARKKENGKQHWVVVTGYSGKHTKNLNAADFLINDPLGKYETLADFISAYKNHYKLVYKTN